MKVTLESFVSGLTFRSEGEPAPQLSRLPSCPRLSWRFFPPFFTSSAQLSGELNSAPVQNAFPTRADGLSCHREKAGRVKTVSVHPVPSSSPSAARALLQPPARPQSPEVAIRGEQLPATATRSGGWRCCWILPLLLHACYYSNLKRGDFEVRSLASRLLSMNLKSKNK